jgi:tRNA threonylcarbamoyladenosine biosynthesis protein TsaE
VERTAATPEDTERHAAAFSRTAPLEAPRALIIYLIGDLGAGKTTWARGFLQTRGAARVRSPTYALLEPYELTPLSIAHLDLYRLSGASEELEALGLRDLDRPGQAWLIEWPERGGAALPPADVVIRLASSEGGRRLTARAGSELGAAWIARAAALLPSGQN